MRTMGLTISGNFMKSDIIKQGNNLIQNIHTCLSLAVDAASNGTDYGAHWERAQQHQSELLRIINQLVCEKDSK